MAGLNLWAKILFQTNYNKKTNKSNKIRQKTAKQLRMV